MLLYKKLLLMTFGTTLVVTQMALSVYEMELHFVVEPYGRMKPQLT